jgi:hypothetical protein
VWIGFEAIPKSDTRDQFFGNFLATVIGAIVGIPIALEITRHQRRLQEAEDESTKGRERCQRQIRILELLRGELAVNRRILPQLIEAQATDPAVVSTVGMKNDLWMSLADGGELHWLDDLTTLDAVANAYYHLRRLIVLEERYFDSGFRLKVSRVGSPQSTFAGEETSAHARDLRPHALEAVDVAIEAVTAKLNELAKATALAPT